MQEFKFRHIKYIQGRKIVLVFYTVLLSFCAGAQEEGFNMLDHDLQKYYFGITGGFNNSQYKTYYSDFFINSDSVLSATPKWNAGFQVGIAANYRFTQHSGMRVLPQFVLMQRSLDYTFKYRGDTTLVIESIMLHLPFHYKFSSDRISNFRFYAFTGGKLDYDFNSNTSSRRNDEVLKIKSTDFGYDLGFGFDFYNSNFIFTPEIRLSNGFGNVQQRDNDIITSKVFDRINTRMVFLSVTVGG
jgi:hypothetical protein